MAGVFGPRGPERLSGWLPGPGSGRRAHHEDKQAVVGDEEEAHPSTLKKDGGAQIYVATQPKKLGVPEMLQKAKKSSKPLAAHAQVGSLNTNSHIKEIKSDIVRSDDKGDFVDEDDQHWKFTSASENALTGLTDGDNAEAIKRLSTGAALLLKTVDDEKNVVGAIAVVYNAGTGVPLAYHDARKCERGAIAHLRGLLEMGELHAVMNKHNGGNGGLPHNLAVCGGMTCVLFGLAEKL